MKDCKKFNELPEEVKEKVKETLKAWQGCYVEDHGDHYEVSIGIALTKGEQPYKVIAAIDADEIYTPEEIRKYADEVWAGVDMSCY